MQFSVLRIYLKVSYPVQIVPMCLGQVVIMDSATKLRGHKKSSAHIHVLVGWHRILFF